MKKPLLTIFIAACVLAFGFALTANADDIATSGSCGDDLTWAFDEATGTLTISGTGDMWDYSYNSSPWYCFRGSVKSMRIEQGVTSIGDCALFGCTSLTSMSIPDGVASIGERAFSSCDALMSVDIPNSVTSMGDHAFYACFNLSSVYFYGAAPSGIDDTTFPSDVTLYYIPGTVGWTDSDAYDSEAGTWNGYVVLTWSGERVTSGQCGDNVYWEFDEAVGMLTISGMGDMWDYTQNTKPWSELVSPIKYVIVEDGVTSIGDYAFSDCESITSVDIRNDVTTIGNYAFWCCHSLTSVDIPDSVTNIGDSAFAGCDSLSSVSIPSSVTSIGYYAFSDCSRLKNVVVSDGVISIEVGTFCGCSSLGSVDIGDGVTSIGDYAFEGCIGLENVTIPDGVTSIGRHAFNGCSSLKSVAIPDGVISIEVGTFYGCSSLGSVDIGDGVTSIGDYAFYDCNFLERVVIPNGVTSIGERAFFNTRNIYFKGDAPTVVHEYSSLRSFHSAATLYYVPGTIGWTYNYDEVYGTWNGWKLEIWEDYHDCEKTGHASGEAVIENEVAATCEAEGSYDTVVYCETCGEELSRETTIIPATGHIYDDIYDLICNACGHERPIPSVPMFRMYDPNSGEHFYTGSERERDFLVTNGWNYEGVAFNFPVIGDPVYRLYNTVTGDHLYTMDLEEREELLAEGWNDEGVAFNSATDDCVPQYRLWNPNAVRGAWHFTGSEKERDFLLGLGWQYQGIGWYSMLE